MSNLKLLEILCEEYKLGIIIEKPLELTGGAKNTVYKLVTDKKSYVIKILNKNTKFKLNFLENLKEVQEIIKILEKNDINILAPIKFENNYCVKIENEWIYVFDYYKGQTLDNEDFTEYHCKLIACEMAKIHKIDLKKNENSICSKNNQINWDIYLDKAKQLNSIIYDELKSNINLIKDCQNNKNRAMEKLPKYTSICHCDIHNENVLWNDMDFKIIDLDLVKYDNPCVEFFKTALKFSGYKEENLDIEKLDIFITEYFKEISFEDVDWDMVFDYLSGDFGWLEFNLKRALSMMHLESEEEIKLGEQKVIEVIRYMKYNRDFQKNKSKRKVIIDCFKQNAINK